MGHSGDRYSLEFLKADKPPKNNKDRLDSILLSITYSADDNTLFFIIVISFIIYPKDFNLSRNGQKTIIHSFIFYFIGIRKK